MNYMVVLQEPLFYLQFSWKWGCILQFYLCTFQKVVNTTESAKNYDLQG